MKKEKYLVTGAAGFIGYFISKKLLDLGQEVIAIDNINDYYDVELKNERLKILSKYKSFIFFEEDLKNKLELIRIMNENKPNYVIHLAAQAGVRYSIEKPDSYIYSNIIGTYNVLEACRFNPVKHLLFASSSSVYGANKKVPFEENDFVDEPVSLYAATKKSNELMAYTYSKLYDIPITGLRFFTVYGPMGRPDMAYFKFLNMFFNNENIHLYNNGDFENDLYRDFTFIDDIIEGIIKLIPLPPKTEVKYSVYNLGNSNPEKLSFFVKTLEKCLSKSLKKDVFFKKVYEPLKAGDVKKTFASTKKLEKKINFKPKTSIEDGLQKFTDWYVEYYLK